MKPLRRMKNKLFHYDENYNYVGGPHKELTGDTSMLFGDCSEIHGVSTQALRGDVTWLSGNITDLTGDCTGIVGLCTNIPSSDRPCDIASCAETVPVAGDPLNILFDELSEDN